jgi:hypothetical protein
VAQLNRQTMSTICGSGEIGRRTSLRILFVAILQRSATLRNAVQNSSNAATNQYFNVITSTR